MTALPFELEPLIAEAKHRMRRRFLAAVGVLALAGAGIGIAMALRAPSGHSLQLAPTSRVGIARIPGIALVASDHSTDICQMKGAVLVDQACGGFDVTQGLDQVWALTSAVARYGIGRAGAVPPVASARGHPGPAMVTVEVRTLNAWQGRDLAEKLLHTQVFTDFGGGDFRPLPAWAIDGGLAETLPDGPNGVEEFRFAWASGTSVVMANVLGAGLTVGEAQRIAALAGPH
jgi:hypothetical protein